ncbi:MAG: hypothetical protein KIT84_02050 [Labilithrix sp.]|nr:hypothetical protein [Labilithrix sp.]MCW5809771.1 hypothetical protein [Labilithrix sp.]
MARRGWATGVVVLVAIAAGGGGGVYLYKEAIGTGTDAAHRDGGPGDASVDARAGRGKSKVAKKGRTRGGKSHAGPKPKGGGDDQGDEGDDDIAEPFNPPFRGRGPAGPTYDAAIASYKREINMGARAEPDLTDAQLSGPMHNGAFVGECGAPDNMKVTVKVAIRGGRPAGVSVHTSPPDPDVAGCIDRYVRTFSWPSSSKMDSFTTTY